MKMLFTAFLLIGVTLYARDSETPGPGPGSYEILTEAKSPVIWRGSILEMRLNESGSHAVPFSFAMLDGKVYTDWVDIGFGGIYPLKIALNNKNQIQLPSKVERGNKASPFYEIQYNRRLF